MLENKTERNHLSTENGRKMAFAMATLSEQPISEMANAICTDIEKLFWFESARTLADGDATDIVIARETKRILTHTGALIGILSAAGEYADAKDLSVYVTRVPQEDLEETMAGMHSILKSILHDCPTTPSSDKVGVENTEQTIENLNTRVGKMADHVQKLTLKMEAMQDEQDEQKLVVKELSANTVESWLQESETANAENKTEKTE